MFFLPSTNLDETNPFFVLFFFLTCIFGLFSLLLGSVTLLAIFFNELGVYQLCELWVLSEARFRTTV